MKISFTIPACVAMAIQFASAQSASYTNFLYQFQTPSEQPYQVPIAVEGQRLSPLAIDPGGARFELWTIRSDPFTSYLLDTKYVSTYTPVADIRIVTEDPYPGVPRTRADRPFEVFVEVNGLRFEPEAPDAAKSLQFTRHVQSYGPGGDGSNINRSQATLLQQVYLNQNQTHQFNFPINAVPGADRTQVRGEERFSAFTLESTPSQLDSKYVQIWPVSRASVSGIQNGEAVRFNAPDIVLTLQDLYPDSRTYAQIYQGPPALGTEGQVIPGSLLMFYEAVPQDRTLILDNWEELINADGQWTIEILTATPFGVDRMAHVTFQVNRSIEVQGTVTTFE